MCHIRSEADGGCASIVLTEAPPICEQTITAAGAGFALETGGDREFFIDNLLVRIHYIIVMIRWTGLAPWEFEFSFLLSDTRVYEPQIRARLGATTHFCGSGCVLPSLWKWLRPPFSVSPDPAPLTRQTCTRSPASSVASLLRPAQRRLPRLLSFCDASAQPGIPSSSSSLLSLQVLEGP